MSLRLLHNPVKKADTHPIGVRSAKHPCCNGELFCPFREPLDVIRSLWKPVYGRALWSIHGMTGIYYIPKTSLLFPSLSAFFLRNRYTIGCKKLVHTIHTPFVCFQAPVWQQAKRDKTGLSFLGGTAGRAVRAFSGAKNTPFMFKPFGARGTRLNIQHADLFRAERVGMREIKCSKDILTRHINTDWVLVELMSGFSILYNTCPLFQQSCGYVLPLLQQLQVQGSAVRKISYIRMFNQQAYMADNKVSKLRAWVLMKPCH